MDFLCVRTYALSLKALTHAEYGFEFEERQKRAGGHVGRNF